MPHPFTTALDRFDHDLLNLKHLQPLAIELKYNGFDNFMKEDLYQGFHEAYLHKLAFEKMQNACALLAQSYPELEFLVFDALRPRSVQVKMRKFVQGTAYQEYVADPALGSLHNFGMAIDLTLRKKSGAELDMGTPFDDFHDLAQPQLEHRFLESGELTQAQYQNRLILRQTMEQAGFQQLAHEWWHYNAFDGAFVRSHFPIVE